MLHDINKLRIFHYVAIEKSLTRAAPILKMKQSFVSKQIASLEKDLGKILFYRRFRGVDLTPDGEKLFSYTKDIMRQIDQLENNLLEEPQSKPLTIVTTTGVTHLWLLERLRENEYFNSSSETLKIVLIDKEFDIRDSFADIAILPAYSSDHQVFKKPLFTGHLKIYASKEYLEKHGTPQKIGDLDHHKLIAFYTEAAATYRGNIDWFLTYGRKPNNPRRPILMINSLIGIFTAAVQGIGIINIPEEMPLLNESPLVEVLQDMDVKQNVDVFFICLKERIHEKRIGELYQLLSEPKPTLKKT